MKHKKIAYIASFGMLWGITELVFGTWLHMLHVPFKGSLLTAIGIYIILTGRKMIPGNDRSSLLSMAVICAVIKFFSIGMVPKPNIYMSILIEAALAQAGLIIAGRTFSGYAFAGALAMLWPPASRILFFGVILGRDYMEFINQLSIGRGLAVGISAVVLLHLAAGVSAGAAAWRSKSEK
ncbi:MAG: hypothetical protein U9O97_07225 [Elusimicrobiota bacterium]|nr:hypothetical protein [Elusimicrobiota bacterium]